MDGAIILDKPEGISSHAAVLAVRRLLSEPRIGHLGTLDPFAGGVLVLLLGNATRLARFYQDREKTYSGTIRFGYSTDTFDCTGQPTSEDRNPSLQEEEIRGLFAEFTGTFLQQPPEFSAKKIAGVPAYRLARKGRKPELAAVGVTGHQLELQSVNGSCAEFVTRVSSGTYIRSLANDLGERLGVGAHLTRLRRTAVGEFTEKDAVTIEQIQVCGKQTEIFLIPMKDLLPEFPAVALPEALLLPVSHGNSVSLDASDPWVRLFDECDRFLCIAERVAEHLYHPTVVFTY